MSSTNYAYWASDTSEGFQVIFNQSGSIYLRAKDGSLLISFSGTGTLSGSAVSHFYQRLILESDGVLRHYVYPKSQEQVLVGP